MIDEPSDTTIIYQEMMMNRHVLSRAFSGAAATAAGIGFALASSQALANTVNLSGFTYGWPTTVTVQSAAPGTVISPFSVYGGQYSGTLDGKSFLTYCAEITQYLSFGTTYNDYAIVDGVTAWGAAKSAMFDHVISGIFGQNINSNTVGSQLAQEAVWEMVYETASTPDLTSGTFKITNTSNTVFDWTAMQAWPIHYHVDLLHSPTAQDLLLISAVPEPASYALLLAGLAGFGFVARRRSLDAERSV